MKNKINPTDLAALQDLANRLDRAAFSWQHQDYFTLNATLYKLIAVYLEKRRGELDICQDCMAGRTAEEVGERVGKRTL
jgi:hypothetical protein